MKKVTLFVTQCDIEIGVKKPYKPFYRLGLYQIEIEVIKIWILSFLCFIYDIQNCDFDFYNTILKLLIQSCSNANTRGGFQVVIKYGRF